MKKIFLFIVFLLIYSQAFFSQATYTWNRTGSANWTVGTNWTPTRTTPATNDILVFNNGATTTANSIPTQTIGQLIVNGNTTVTLQAAGTPTLTIGGGTGDDLSVENGSNLNISGSSVLLINVATGATGSITGNMTFTSAAHKLTAADASGITFSSPAIFTAGTGFSSNAFGSSGTNNTIIFGNGSTYISSAGANPFGSTAPNSKVLFQTGSLFQMNQIAAPGLNGRTYANFEVTASNFNQSSTGSTGVTMDNLTVSAGTFNINTTGVNAVTIKGNIEVAVGAALNFIPATASTLTLNGTSLQNITNNGTLTFQNNESIVCNNASGISINQALTLEGTSTSSLTIQQGVVTISGDLTVNKALILTGGTIDSRTNNKTVIANSTLSRTNGWVNGKLKRPASDGNTDYFIGSASVYTPVTIGLIGSSGSQITAISTLGNAPAGSQVDQSNKCNHYWTLTLDEGTLGTASTAFDLTNTTNGGTVANYILQKYDGSWASTTSSVAGNVITATGLTSFSTFETGQQVTLPVKLLSFDLRILDNNMTGIKWETSETNNSHFLIEWSRDAKEWNEIGTVKGSGTTHDAKEYSYIHENPKAGINYYRLTQVDFDGRKETFPAKAIFFESNHRNFDIIPNLAFNNVKIEFEKPVENGRLHIYNIDGQLMQTYVLASGIDVLRIDVSELPAGQYIAKYIDGEETINKKFIKQ